MLNTIETIEIKSELTLVSFSEGEVSITLKFGIQGEKPRVNSFDTFNLYSILRYCKIHSLHDVYTVYILFC